ncbi:MAG: hypothetical protein PUB42_04160 [Firmicutes bacterium]|nr:hypothetical protein [Bacillota bacterium]
MGKKLTAADITVTVIDSNHDFQKVIEDCFKIYLENELAKLAGYNINCSTIPETAPIK